MNLSKIIENLILILLFFILLLIGNGFLFDNKLAHDFPYGYLASDAFQHQVRAEAIKDAGNFRYEANYISRSFDNAVGRYPPVIYHLGVIFSYSAGLEIYDSIYFIVFFFASLSALAMYFIIKGINRNIAILSIPMFILVFANPANIGFTWGHWPSVLGQVFLICVFWSVYRIEIRKSYLLIGAFLSSVIMAHTSELVFALFFIFLYFACNLIFLNLKFSQIKSVLYAFLIAIFVSFYYLVIFKNSWFIAQPYQFFVKPIWDGNPGLYLSDFKIFLAFILFGIAIFFATLKKCNVALLAGFSMLIMGFGNYFGFDVRAFQLRFFWPFYLAVFFGTGIFFIGNKLIRKWNMLFSIIFSFALFLLILNIVKIPYFPKYEKSTGAGLMDPFMISKSYHWEALKWLSDKTAKDSKLYFFYGDIYSQDALLRNSKRIHFLVDTGDYVHALNSRLIKRYYLTELPGDGGGGIVYKKGFFSFGDYDKETDKEYFMGEKDVCSFDYLIFDKVSRQDALAKYNLLIANEMLKNNFVEVAYNNELILILKNNKIGGDCIEERAF